MFNFFKDRNHTLFIGSFFIKVIENQPVWSFCLRYANENFGKQWDPCIIRISNLKVIFTKKSAHYTRLITVSVGWQSADSWWCVGKMSVMVSQMLQNSTTCTFIFNNLYLCSTRYIYIQHFRFMFNKTHFLSTSTQISFIEQQYLFNFNPNYFHSTKIIIQLQSNMISFNNKVPGHPKFRHSTKFPFPPPS